MNTTNQDITGNATILVFPRKRGRPKTIHRGIDRGTPELLQKRRNGETTETLDYCLERGFITKQQHWCGIHLRWLYTLRHGAPSVRAIDLTHNGGMEIKTDDPQWRTEREKEYHEAIRNITQSGHALLLMNICIYNERPKLLSHPTKASKADSSEMAAFKNKLQSGLEVLNALWSK